MKKIQMTLVMCIVLLAVSTQSNAWWWNSNYTKTKYPIVLVHGLFGFDQAFGSYDYFFRIPGELSDDGARVYVADVSAANSSEVRGEQLLEQLETLQAYYGHSKFNLIGHSHGSPTIRYVASIRPDLVASVTAVGGPNTGSDVADAVAGLVPPGSFLESMIDSVVSAFAVFIEVITGGAGDPQSAISAMVSLSSEGSAVFNAQYPEGMPASYCGEGQHIVNGIRYFSFSGTGVVTNILDPVDAVLGAGSLFFDEANDGLVGRCSSHLGKVLRDDYYWNHGDEINQVLGLKSWFASSPISVYRSHANRLKNLGL
jgi:triacylglycerol lipase